MTTPVVRARNHVVVEGNCVVPFARSPSWFVVFLIKKDAGGRVGQANSSRVHSMHSNKFYNSLDYNPSEKEGATGT